MKVHSPVNTYTCDYCDVAYRTLISLKKHIKKVHVQGETVNIKKKRKV